MCFKNRYRPYEDADKPLKILKKFERMTTVKLPNLYINETFIRLSKNAKRKFKVNFKHNGKPIAMRDYSLGMFSHM